MADKVIQGLSLLIQLLFLFSAMPAYQYSKSPLFQNEGRHVIMNCGVYAALISSN